MSKKPKILIYDIETAPALAWIWKPGYGINVAPSQLHKDSRWDIITIAYKWYGQKTVHCLDWGLKKQNSREMLAKFLTVWEKADAVITYNGDSFDNKRIQTLAAKHGLKPFAPVMSLDLFPLVKKHFSLLSNSLDEVAKYFGVGRKIKTDMSLWTGVMYKDAQSLRDMRTYNKGDVVVTEEVLDRISEYVDWKKKIAVFINKDSQITCPNPACLSDNVRKNGWYIAKTIKHYRLECKDCSNQWATTKRLNKEQKERVGE